MRGSSVGLFRQFSSNFLPTQSVHGRMSALTARQAKRAWFSTPSMRLEQITPIGLSDHKSYVVTFSDGRKIAFGNDTKQGSEKITEGKSCFNNALPYTDGDGKLKAGKHEDIESYRARTLKTKAEDIRLIKNDPAIFALCKQEFRIHPEHVAAYLKEVKKVSGWENALLHTTKHAVTTIFKSNADAQQYFLDEKVDADLKQKNLNERVQLFNLKGGRESIANAHIPDDGNPGKSYEAVCYTLYANKIVGLTKEPRKIVLGGDKNLSADEQRENAEKAFWRLVGEQPQGAKPFSIISSVVGSPDGHMRRGENGEPVFVAADGVQEALLFESEAYSFEHVPEAEAGMFRFWLGLIAGGSIVASNVIGDDFFAFEALAAVAAADPKLTQELTQVAGASITSAWQVGGPAFLAAVREPEMEELCHFDPRPRFGRGPSGIA